LERKAGEEALQVIDSMVARDGVEPPTPAFSGLYSTIVISQLIRLRLQPEIPPTEAAFLRR
jgi:hypothetical protein